MDKSAKLIIRKMITAEPKCDKMIHAFNFTCWRDLDLSYMMEKTLRKHCSMDIYFHRVNTDQDHSYIGYSNGAGWPQGMMKIAYLKTMSFADDDWILSVDSDVVFCNSDVFKALDPEYGIIGVLGQQPWDTFYGKWSHMSGCLIFLRGDVARQMTVWQQNTFDAIRQNHFKDFAITENEDVMLSYFARMQGAEQKDISEFHSSNFEENLIYCAKLFAPFTDMHSFYHLNYNPETFLGEPMHGAKWEIPRVLKAKGIEL